MKTIMIVMMISDDDKIVKTWTQTLDRDLGPRTWTLDPDPGSRNLDPDLGPWTRILDPDSEKPGS